MGSQPTTTELMERNKALAAELALEKQLRADVTVNNVTFIKQIRRLQASEEEQKIRAKALEADRDQISLTLAVAKADRDKWFNRARDLEAALRGLYDDNVDYLRLNNLGGYDNHWLVAARKALGLTAETTVKPTLIGMDLAGGPSKSGWYCTECGYTDYPCNHLKASQADRGSK